MKEQIVKVKLESRRLRAEIDVLVSNLKKEMAVMVRIIRLLEQASVKLRVASEERDIHGDCFDEVCKLFEGR